ncbi:MAG: hypothetical protein IIZ67_06210 [Bacilli bacterium]|nr:hypothetical protein [Bacilli bacterium]
MNNINNLRPFPRFCVTLGMLPTSYKESMTYEEQLLWLCRYLETEVIPKYNENVEAINQLITLYNQLKDYVDNYFENLDVQQEINNKLDEMAESGELAEIIVAYLQMKGILGYDTLADLKSATNIIDGSICKTLGNLTYLDGLGKLYRVREKTDSDVIDDIIIVGLTNFDGLVAELINENTNVIYETLTDLKNDSALFDGKKVRTLGYHNVNDNGGAFYLVRTKTVSDTPDEGSIVSINDDLVAELIVEDVVNVKQFGAYGNGEEDDSEAIQNAVDYIEYNYYQINIGIKSSKPLFFPAGKYLIRTAIESNGAFSIIIKGENSILFSDNSNNCFNFGDYSAHPLYIENISFNNFDRAININALNIDRSRSKISKCEFNSCNTAIYNINQSAILKIEDCTFMKCDKIINNNHSDCVIFDTCWFADKVYANDEDVSIILNSGIMRFENCFFIPAGASQTANKLAWIEIPNNGNEKRLYINNCRISAEAGYKTLVNYKEGNVETNLPGKYLISITNCPMISGSPMIRLYKLCNNIIIENNNFNAIGNKIIELDSSLTITPDSYGGMANGFMFDNRIIIKGNHSVNQQALNQYPGELIDITESDFNLTKQGTTTGFYIGSFSEEASTIVNRQSYLVKGIYWLDTSGIAGTRQFTGIINLYTSGGKLYADYQDLNNDNTSLSVTYSFNGTEVHDGNVTATYSDVSNITLNGAAYYLKLTLNIKCNYTVNVSITRL